MIPTFLLKLNKAKRRGRDEKNNIILDDFHDMVH
jgi:hypothetical protein